MAIDKFFPKKSNFRPINRFERSDPSLKRLYQKQKSQWESEAEKARKEWDEYVKEMERLYGKDWERVLQQKKLEGQRATRKAEVERAAEDMRSGKTSSFKGAAAGGIPTFKPETLDTKKAEGPVQVRRAIPQQRVFKAMIEGKPEESQVFDTEDAAKAFIKEKGGRGAVASVRGTPEEMTRYKEESKAGEREKERLSKLYKQRQEEAQGRVAKAREVMQAYDEATTPAQKESARAGIEAARLESATAQSTRGMSEEQKKKFRSGLGSVLEGRTQREAETEAKTRVARAESREQEKSKVMQKDVTKQISDYKKSLSALKRAYNQARQAGDEFGAFQLLEYIKYFTANVPEDEKKLREYAMSGRLAEDQKYLRSIAGDQKE